jgi:O-antigen/teichoic acid export membrane protein
VAILLGVRFLLELSLLAALGIVGFNASDDAAVGALIGAALVISAATVWGAILSPRRRLDPPVGVRLTVELALFAGAAIGLAATGYPTWGAVLFTAELLTVGALWAMGHPPGADVATKS